jgi:hypothetical protein
MPWRSTHGRAEAVVVRRNTAAKRRGTRTGQALFFIEEEEVEANFYAYLMKRSRP